MCSIATLYVRRGNCDCNQRAQRIRNQIALAAFDFPAGIKSAAANCGSIAQRLQLHSPGLIALHVRAITHARGVDSPKPQQPCVPLHQQREIALALLLCRQVIARDEEQRMATLIMIENELKNRIGRLADARRRSLHWVMREAIEQYVSREEQREAFKQESLDSWRDYQETGQHLTGREVDRWLRTWGTNEEHAAPQCHK